MTNRTWQCWREDDWNKHLLHHFFGFADIDRPVSCLSVCPEELAASFGLPSSDETPFQAFIQIVCRPVREFNRALSVAHLPPDWQSMECPPFLIFLLFSCHVASAQEETASEGQFRKRLAQLLGHAPGTQYPLRDLTRLWEELRDWIERKRMQGDPFRPLVLPELGFRLIGYSLQLAFPERRDKRRLQRLLRAQGFTGIPPIQEIIEFIGSHISLFREGFVSAYDDFRKAYSAGAGGLERHRFWSAIIQNIRDFEHEGEKGRRGLSPRLFAEFGSDMSLELYLACRNWNWEGEPSLSLLQSDALQGDLSSVVALNGNGVAGINNAIELLLCSGFEKAFPGVIGRNLQVAVREGILIFVRNEDGLWELSCNRPAHGSMYLLVHDDLVESFCKTIPHTARSRLAMFRSVYANWHEVHGLNAGDLPYSAQMAGLNVRCLRQTIPLQQICLEDGICFGNERAYLGLKDVMPTVRFTKGCQISVAGSTRPGEKTLLIPETEESERYLFPGSFFRNRRVEGGFVIQAEHGETVLAQRRVLFSADVYQLIYGYPANPSNWLIESGLSDVSEVRTSTIPYHGSYLTVPQEDTSRNRADGQPEIAVLRSSIKQAVTCCSQEPEIYLSHELCPRARDFFDALAALSFRVSGMGEMDLYAMTTQFLGDELPGGRAEPLIRAWQEIGLIDRLMNRRWRVARYFARSPALLLKNERGSFVATLIGLAPSVLLQRLDGLARTLGLERVDGTSPSPWIPPPCSFVGQSLDAITRFAKETGLALVQMPGLREFIVPAARAFSRQDVPINYERDAVWCWSRCCFTRAADREAISLFRCRRTPPDRPDYYLIESEGVPLLYSYSKIWALLAGHLLRGTFPFELTPGGSLISRVPSNCYLPLPVGRLGYALGAAPGPVQIDGKSTGYAYRFPDIETARAVVSLLSGYSVLPRGISEELLKIAVRSGGGRFVPLPLAYRQAFADRYGERFPEFLRKGIPEEVYAMIIGAISRAVR